MISVPELHVVYRAGRPRGLKLREKTDDYEHQPRCLLPLALFGNGLWPASKRVSTTVDTGHIRSSCWQYNVHW
jgi:hypothetical protein